MQTVDYSFSRPDPGWIAASGFVGAMRYLAPLPNSKVLTAAEIAALHAAGLGVGVVWETSADRAAKGYQAGRDDVARAEAMAADLGFPADRPIYYAVDFDGSVPEVSPYFDGVADGAARPWGVYGSYRIVEGLASRTPWLWQCAAWSGSGSGSGGSIQNRRLSAHAVMFQRVGYVLGNTSDANDVLRPDWGGWFPGHQAANPPTEEVDEMPSLLILNPDVDGEWWEVSGLFRRRMSTAFGMEEVALQQFLGAKVLDGTTGADGRRLWLNSRIPVSAPTTPQEIAKAVVDLIPPGATDVDEKALGAALADALAKRLAD